MRKHISVFLTMLILLYTAAVPVSAGAEYKNTFDPDDLFAWKKNYSGNSNYISFADAKGEGYQKTNGKKIIFDHSDAAAVNTAADFTIPDSWKLDSFKTQSWIHFMIRGDNAQEGVTSMRIELRNVGNESIFKTTFQSPDNQWEHVIIPVEQDISTAVTVKISDNMKGAAGAVILDDFAMTDTKPERVDTGRPISMTIDFDDVAFSRNQYWAGFKNTAGDYSDYIRSEVVSGGGKKGNGFRLYYQSATYYAGEVFCELPPAVDLSLPVEYVSFDVKGKAKIKVKMETGTYLNGIRYETGVAVDTGDEWKTIKLPLKSFVNKDIPVQIKDVVGMAFSAWENANLSNNAETTKAMSADELLAKAKVGEVMIDNITFTTVPIISMTLTQNGEAIERIADAKAGTVILEVVRTEDIQPAQMYAALYEKGVLKEIFAMDGETAEFHVTSPQNAALKIFCWDANNGMVPLYGAADTL